MDRFYPYRITYDIECFLPRDDLPNDNDKLNYVAGDLMSRRHTTLVKAVETAIEWTEAPEAKWRDRTFSNASHRATRVGLCRLRDKLEQYLRAIPVIGFNSQHYDLNVLKPALMRVLGESEEGEVRFVIKRANSLTCLETRTLHFIDVCNHIAPNCNYAHYVKTFGCEQKKGHFPYEWMGSIAKLEWKSLPDRQAFASSFKGTVLSEEEYEVCATAWRTEGMETFKDFLTWYNNLDVQPLLEAVTKHAAVYALKGIDMFKDAISLPGLAIRWMFGECDDGGPSIGAGDAVRPGSELCRDLSARLPIRLLDEQERDLYQLIKDNLVEGPGIIFHRYHE